MTDEPIPLLRADPDLVTFAIDEWLDIDQPAPVPNDRLPVVDRVLCRIQERVNKGLETYKVKLQPFNGRRALTDALDEIVDLTFYLEQEVAERQELDEKVRSLEAEVARLNGLLDKYAEWIKGDEEASKAKV